MRLRTLKKRNFRYVFIVTSLTLLFLFIRNYHNNVKPCPNSTEWPLDRDMDDMCLINYIRKYRMELPSQLPYNMSSESMNRASTIMSSQLMGMDHFWTDAVFFAEKMIPEEKRTKRFFECGASNGEFMSQTYFAERFLGWTGMLVEADMYYFNIMKEKHRKAYQFSLCASTSTKSNKATFLHVEKWRNNGTEHYTPGDGRILNGKKGIPEEFRTHGTKLIDVFCVPVYSIMTAVNMPSVDIFFLDVEGPELEILKTMPFDKIDVSIFVVEHNSVPGKLERLENFFHEKGYVLQESSIIDSLFARKEYLKESRDFSKSFYDRLHEWFFIAPVRD
ncbi:uncharacterized protein LOC136037257 isoform X2 [Artemia franciscana]|uniref:uncharacterized protein LOC136037257 isoform X2 n=1 Tax=Artemia franciscana TaxID=6661 RepID=UPI0032D9AE8E